jgi:large subunit ribosomal protein L21
MAITNKISPKIASSEGAFAVIKTGAKQYRVSEGLIISMEILKGEHALGEKVEFTDVLLKDDGTTTTVGAPMITGAKVVGEIVEIGRSPKVVGMRYKQKSRSRSMKFGHRQPFFKVKITNIA